MHHKYLTKLTLFMYNDTNDNKHCLHSELKLLHTLLICKGRGCLLSKPGSFTSEALWPQGMFVFRPSNSIFSQHRLRNCVSRSVGPANIVAATQMIYSSEESLGLKWETTGADTLWVGIVCDGVYDSDFWWSYTWIMPINTLGYICYCISETRCKMSPCMRHKIIPVYLSLCVCVCVRVICTVT